MVHQVTPSSISGQLRAPASKSLALRALTAALLSRGTNTLTGYTPCNDTEDAIRVIQAIGAKVNRKNDVLSIVGIPPSKSLFQSLALHCGESGLLARLFASVALLYSNNIELTGKGSLLSRPMNIPPAMKEQMGIRQIKTSMPSILHLQGQLKASLIQVDGSGGSQFLSGLLMALSVLEGNSEIMVDNLQSQPYIDLTIDVMNDFGVTIKHDGYSHYFIKGGQRYQPCRYTIEGDWSSASCLLIAGAIAGKIELTGLNPESKQADRAIVDVLQKAGANVSLSQNSIKVSKNSLHPFCFDATHCPDLFPALAVLAANCKGQSRITGINRLVDKESNRALTLQSEFANIGVKVSFDNNDMLIEGSIIHGGNTHAHNDHRIAMAMAVAGLTAQSTVCINGAECVNKSYPEFFNDLLSVQNLNDEIN